ncbi:terminase [Mycobacterium phage Nozo]|nr:terminase [Mycobacterium phage Nozo]
MTTPFDVPENRRRKVGFRDDEKPIFEPTWDDDGMFSSAKAARIYEAARSWPADQKAAAIRYIEAAKNRAQIRKRYANAAELATAVDPEFVITPALRIISDAIEDVLRYPRCNLLVTMPPQEGKSTMCAVWTPIRALQLNPNRRIILATYGDSLADQHSTTARDLIMRYGTGVTDALTGLAVEDKLGLKINPKQAKVSSWRIDGAIGGMVAAGLGSAITGKSADLFIIDDPFKNMIEADSARHREKVNEWFASVASTRLSPEASMILIQCMTGDTPVLRPDGTETPLADIRPGDEIATYENGTLTRANVVNWASQGYDSIRTITMMDGTTVRANDRHPFLTVGEDGTERWVRVRDLKPGIRLRAVPGSARRAAPTDATCRCRARGCVCPITTKPAGPPDSSLSRRISGGIDTFGTGTESRSKTIAGSLWSRAVSAERAANPRVNSIVLHTGRGSSASITATTPAECAGCSAMTATSSSGEHGPLNDFVAVPIISIEPAGRAEVFDIQVERTENFIANGLVSHNTRWHPEDLSGTIIAGEKLLDAEDRTWRHINVPAVSEEGIPDALGRPEPGIPMISARGRTLREFNQTRKSVGERVWYALYQGSPRNPAGGLFMRAWFEPMAERSPERPLATIVAIDPADSGEGDETGIIGGMLDRDGTIVLTDDWSDQLTSDKWGRQAVLLALKLGAREIAMEAYASATTYANVIKNAWKALHREAVEKHSSGAALSPVEQRALATNMPFVIHQWRGKGDDVGRSALLRQQCETRKCLVVEGRMQTFVDQACDWQAGQHQPDRVAAAVIAHDRLHQLGGGMMQLPAGPTRKPPPAPTWMKRTIKKKGLG